VNLWHLYNL
jgi:hypothetical protein